MKKKGLQPRDILFTQAVGALLFASRQPGFEAKGDFPTESGKERVVDTPLSLTNGYYLFRIIY